MRRPCVLLLGSLRAGDLKIALHSVQVLGADTAPLGLTGDTLQSLEIVGGLHGIGFGGRKTVTGLSNFFRPGAVAQASERLLLNPYLRLGLIRLQGERAHIHFGEQIACLDAIAFLRVHPFKPPTAIERQGDLTNVHVAVQHQPAIVAGLSDASPSPDSDTNSHCQHDNDEEPLFHEPHLRRETGSHYYEPRPD